MKAYALTEEYEGTGGIYFADYPIVARRQFAEEFNEGELRGISCRRAPWADKCKASPVPASLMIDHGWRFECSGCGQTVDIDYLEDNDLNVDEVIGSQFSQIFCSPQCHFDWQVLEAERKAVQVDFIHKVRERIRRRLGDVSFVSGGFQEHCYATKRQGHWVVEQCRVSIDFPGRKHSPAAFEYRFEYRQVGPPRIAASCAQGDLDVFTPWVTEREKKRSPTHTQQ